MGSFEDRQPAPGMCSRGIALKQKIHSEAKGGKFVSGV